MMTLDELVRHLGYGEYQDRWITDGIPDGSTAPVLREARKAGVLGTYLFSASPGDDPVLPPRPVVHVAEAATPDDARAIHRRLWNLGRAPFLIVRLPGQARVYATYKFAQDDEKCGLIVEESARDAIIGALAAFGAAEIDSGRIWSTYIGEVSLESRVDAHLLRSLNELGDRLVEDKKLELSVAHALIGKYIYIRYLRDRSILSDAWLEETGVVLDDVFSRNATLQGLRRFVEAIEERFNGRIFPIQLSEDSIPDDSVISYVAGVFRGDSPSSGQLALDFQAYDFSYIPIETLSSIYEQFLHRANGQKSAGAYYTPEPLADYLLSEVNYTKPLRLGMRVLDPCCGSGVFLVLAYRRLIEMERASRPDGNLRPQELGRILRDSIYGVERNEEACCVTEFSLILTLLSYVEPPDLHMNREFKFPSLRDANIFACDFFDDKSEFWKQDRRFDWVVGNPPWIQINCDSAEEELALQWMQNARAGGRPVALNRACEAFSWRATDVLAPDGCAGLVVHATSLTNAQSEDYRREFFRQNAVHRITNFSNLAYILFAGRSEAPAATVTYKRSDPSLPKPAVVHYGPFVANQVTSRAGEGPSKGASSITVYENEIVHVSHEEAESGDGGTWKQALWATYRDRRAISRLAHLFPLTLSQLADSRDWKLRRGLELGNSEKAAASEGGFEYAPDLANYKYLKPTAMSGSRFRFTVPAVALHDIPEENRYIRKRGGRAGFEVARGPHLVISPEFAAFSDLDFVLLNDRIAISCPAHDGDYLRAVSALLCSSVARYMLFFQSTSWGVDRSRLLPADVKNMRLPDLSDPQVARLSALHSDLSALEMEGVEPRLVDSSADRTRVAKKTVLELQAKLDEAVAGVLEIPGGIRDIASDFARTRYSLIKGKARGAAVEPTEADLVAYCQALRESLDDYAGVRHAVSLLRYRDFTVCTVKIGVSDGPAEPVIQAHNSRLASPDSEVWQALRQQFSQWVYVQRGLRAFVDGEVRIYKPSRLLDWAYLQALLDSDDIIAEVLSRPEAAL